MDKKRFVAVFTDGDPAKLSDKVNQWIEEKGVNVIDIKFSHSTAYDPENADPYMDSTSIMVVYEAEESIKMCTPSRFTPTF